MYVCTYVCMCASKYVCTLIYEFVGVIGYRPVSVLPAYARHTFVYVCLSEYLYMNK